MSKTPDDTATTNDPKAEPPPSPTPPRGPRPRTVLAWLTFGAVMLAAGVIWANAIQPGIARLWGTVVPASGQATTRPGSDAEARTTEFYTCGMHPWVILPEPGLCPICHMDLTPIDPDKFTGEITIDPVITQNIGVRIEPVTVGPVVRTIRTVGTIEYDETGVRDVNIKVSGWIEKLYVDYLGAAVDAGQPLFDLYSPQLYEAQEEYLLALKRGTEARTHEGTMMPTLNLLDAARTRLEYYDITPGQIEALEQRGVAAKTMTIHTPHRGVVIAKHANEGMHVTEGMQVYRIADLSKIWVAVPLYEYQFPFVKTGQSAVMTLSYIPGQEFEGQVIYIYPYLDEKTRQVNVRLEFDNPDGLLKPGMYATVELRSVLATERTLAPRSAILDTGERQVAFVSLGGGRFEPRLVRVGVEMAGGMVEILDGLNPGEMIVTSGQFLLDSEAKIREGLAKMVKGTPAIEQEAVVVVVGASELPSLPAEARTALGAVLAAYFAIGDTLADDTTEGISADARKLADGVDRLLEVEIPDHPRFWHRHDEIATVRGEAVELIDAAIDEARLSFADLGAALSKLVRATGVPEDYPAQVQELHCPMYRRDQGGSIWLQPAGDVRNPFYGSMMLECFDERRTLAVTGAPE